MTDAVSHAPSKVTYVWYESALSQRATFMSNLGVSNNGQSYMQVHTCHSGRPQVVLQQSYLPEHLILSIFTMHLRT